MSDIYCALCKEPWDAYGVRHGDMEPAEAARFLHGKGCPTCGFGQRCPSCYGTGKDTDGPSCSTCMGMRKVLARRMAVGGGPWQYGYIPTVQSVPYDAIQLPDKSTARLSRDGWFIEVWFRCWSCHPDVCPECNGDGKLHRAADPIAALRSECNASDEDPMEIINRRGF